MRGVGGGDASVQERERARFVRAYDAARAADDVDAMVDAAIGLAGTQVFGTIPGRLPAFLHEAYTRATGEQRARLAVAIARAWAYGGDPARAEQFAAEALTFAEANRNSALLAAALDASLLVQWGPDDLATRLRITDRLEATVAHMTDVEAQMNARLWRLTTALESLDRPAAIRQLRALDALASESSSTRVEFFARSRHAMFALLNDDVPAARVAAADAITAGYAAGEADAFAIERALTAAIARHNGDVAVLAEEAERYEAFAEHEGVMSVGAEAAMLWASAGDHERAGRLLHWLAGTAFERVARDVDWALTMASLTEAAITLRAESLLATAVDLLAPYAGRGIVNAGAVGFVGVVDDYLARACTVLGRTDDALRYGAAAADAYARIGAPWWARRCQQQLTNVSVEPVTREREIVVHLRPGDDGVWWIGRDGTLTAVRDVKGLRYLRVVLERPGVDVSAIDLSATGAASGASPRPANEGIEHLDRQALGSYRRRLAEIDVELDEARSWTDPARVELLERERDALLGEVRAATGLGGRVRRDGATDERARVAVRKAIASAIARIAAVDPTVGRMLEQTVRTGAHCRYDPDPDRPVRWVLAGERAVP